MIKIFDSLCQQDFHQIIVYITDLLLDMTLSISPELQLDCDVEEWAANVTDAEFEEAGIPPKYRPLLRSLDQVSDGFRKDMERLLI